MLAGGTTHFHTGTGAPCTATATSKPSGFLALTVPSVATILLPAEATTWEVQQGNDSHVIYPACETTLQQHRTGKFKVTILSFGE